MSRHVTVMFITVAVWLLMMPAAHGQTDSSIAGIVRDSTGGVLPGATVEVSSPALIEKVRVAVTDGSGQYRVIELRPGRYAVTFTLPGFTTVRREGITLTSGFTATVDGELPVGDVAETLTVVADAPVVDARSAVQQRVMTRDIIDALPTGKSFANLGVLIPGTTTFGYGRALDVGGALGHSNQMLLIHGSQSFDQTPLVDGMSVDFVGLGFSTLNFADSNVEEINLGLGGHSAEVEKGGVRVNIIPKSGGNQFTGTLFGNFANSALQSDNLGDDQRARGLTAVDRVHRLAELNGALGGPIVKDRLWFYAGYRMGQTRRFGTVRFDTDLTDWVYAPDVSREPAKQDKEHWGAVNRFTWQASSLDRIAVNLSYDEHCHCTQSLAGQQEPLSTAEADQLPHYFNRLGQVTWQRPAGQRLLFEGGASYFFMQGDFRPEPSAKAPAARELNTGISFNARSGAAGLIEFYPLIRGPIYTGRFSTSYVSGAHTLKAGFTLNPGRFYSERRALGDYLVVLLNGVPNRVEFFATPYEERAHWNKLAVFVQDQWTLNRLTVNAGLRFDQHTAGYPEANQQATRYLPARSFTGAEVLNWKDLSPRLGVSYDLFGNGKTALKAGLNRYLVNESYGFANSGSPTVTSTARLTRSWIDANRDFIPQGDPLNPLSNGELGPTTNELWGQPRITLNNDPEWANGWGVRGYNWVTTISAQHELIPRLSLNATYNRRVYGNQTIVDNRAVAPSDYSPFCITAPTDSRFPRGGGYDICSLYDIDPAKLGAVDNFRTLASNYGRQDEYWHGVDLTVDARLPNGVLLQGGVSTGRRVTDNCDVVDKVDNPSQLYCHSDAPFWAPSIKFSGAYPLPGQFELAGVLQSMAGVGQIGLPAVQAIYVATNAEIAPSLGRNLSSGVNGAVNVNVIEPNSLLSDRINQLDLRVSRKFRGRPRIRVMFDLYNALNVNPVTSWNPTYGRTGESWLAPTQILTGRIGKFSVQVDF